MADLPSYNALIVVAGASTAFTNEACSDTGDGLTFQTTLIGKSILDPDGTFTVEVDSGGGFSTVSASDYTLDYVVGKITFDSSQAGNSVRISGDYHPRHVLAAAREASLEIVDQLLEANRFRDDGERRLSGRQDISAIISVLDELMDPIGSGEDAILTTLSSGGRTALEIAPASGVNNLFRFWCRYESQGQELSDNSVSTAALQAQGTILTPAMSAQPRNLWGYRIA